MRASRRGFVLGDFREGVELETNVMHHRKNRRNAMEELCGSSDTDGKLMWWS